MTKLQQQQLNYSAVVAGAIIGGFARFVMQVATLGLFGFIMKRIMKKAKNQLVEIKKTWLQQ